MRLILSTDGTAARNYLDLSTEAEISVPQVEDIRHSRRVEGAPTFQTRSTVHVDLTGPQAVAIAIQLLLDARDEGVISAWRVSFPEREEAGV